MITQPKPKPSAPEETAGGVGLPDSIFAGLQFPTVPTNTPVYTPKITTHTQQMPVTTVTPQVPITSPTTL